MKYSLGFFSSAPLVGIALMGCATAAAAETIQIDPPTVTEIEVACHVVNGQQHTVRIAYRRPLGHVPDYRVVFQNVQDGSALPLSMSPEFGPGTTVVQGYQFFNIPAGVYNVTIASTAPDWRGELTVRNITVPATVSTGGRGTGCKFLGDTRQRR